MSTKTKAPSAIGICQKEIYKKEDLVSSFLANKILLEDVAIFLTLPHLLLVEQICAKY